MTSSAVFTYIEGYLFTLFILEFMLTAGLNHYISMSISSTSPTLAAPTFLSGDPCVHTAALINVCFDWMYNIGTGIYFFFYNIYFLLSLSFSSSAFGVLGWIFTFMSIMFALCILLIIRG